MLPYSRLRGAAYKTCGVPTEAFSYDELELSFRAGGWRRWALPWIVSLEFVLCRETRSLPVGMKNLAWKGSHSFTSFGTYPPSPSPSRQQAFVSAKLQTAQSMDEVGLKHEPLRRFLSYVYLLTELYMFT